MLHIYYKYTAEFEILVWDIFNFSEPFWTYNFFTNAWTSL